MVNQSAGTHQESVETAVLVYFLDTVEKTADYVVSAGGLTTREDNANIYRFAYDGIGILFKLQFGQTVSVREQLLNLFLVGN